MHKTNKDIELKEKNNRNRGFNGFNTGTRTMQSERDYKRLKPATLTSTYQKNREGYNYEL